MNAAAKQLRDMRTAEWRRVKKAFTDPRLHAELKDELMGEEYVPRDATCWTDRTKFSRAFKNFKQACQQCDSIETTGNTN